MTRLRQSIWALLVAIDILACTIWLGALYPLYLSDKPTGRQMISSYVGEAAHNGKRWAKRAAFVIDHLALAVGDRPAHCDRAYRKYRDIDD